MSQKKPESKREPANRVLEITRIFSSPRHLVFEAWTRNEHIREWCAPKGFTIPFSEGDLRPGGKWRSCMRTPDGTDCWLSGVYREIVQDQLIEFTHAWEEDGKRGHETIVTVKLSDYGRKTKMVLRQSLFESVASRDGHKGGWSQCLDRLSAHLK
ncbi:MAG TPA: SRPBCC domain-containing protein [Lacunisphaera sp.]|jgi:uncharacterized protein YndB with AHSA1/START domain